MVAVPFGVLVCVSGFSVYFCLQASIIVWCDQNVQEWYGTIILMFSVVNLMWLPREFIWWKNSSFYDVSRMTKVSSTYLFHRLGGYGADSRACFSKCSIKMLATMGLKGLPIVAPSICW